MKKRIPIFRDEKNMFEIGNKIDKSVIDRANLYFKWIFFVRPREKYRKRKGG